jgi:hypothetical protein
MKLGTETLVGRKASISKAERTLASAITAVKRGDLRLASSRAVTAAVQAATASIGASPSVVRRADQVTKDAREIIQGIVISEIAIGAI